MSMRLLLFVLLPYILFGPVSFVKLHSCLKKDCAVQSCCKAEGKASECCVDQLLVLDTALETADKTQTSNAFSSFIIPQSILDDFTFPEIRETYESIQFKSPPNNKPPCWILYQQRIFYEC